MWAKGLVCGKAANQPLSLFYTMYRTVILSEAKNLLNLSEIVYKKMCGDNNPNHVSNAKKDKVSLNNYKKYINVSNTKHYFIIFAKKHPIWN